MSSTASDYTVKANYEAFQNLPFDKSNPDMEDIRRGLICETPELVIKDDSGAVIWNAKSYINLLADKKSPDTVNPSLWRHQRLEAIAGLFEVTDGIWQIRGYDVSNLTIIRSDNGYIVVDTLMGAPMARAAIELFFEHLPKRPIKAIIVTHPHGDHTGGLAGVLDANYASKGQTSIIVPENFMEQTMIERVFVGPAMMRRGAYQFGQKLPINVTGCVGTGLGIGIGRPGVNFIKPTVEIHNTGEKVVADGVEFEFLMAKETEAPTEFCFYLPQFKTLCMSELINPLLHNLLPVRGAQARSARKWAQAIQEAIVLFADRTDVLILGHGWPVWGKENIVNYLKKQRDLYKFINDQTARAINQGMTMNEIAESIKLPPSLAQEWHCRNYYGHLKHNVKATYQFYMGFYDGNPAHLDPLPPIEESRRYIDFMGGASTTLDKVKGCIAKGEYRWAATVLNHLVFSCPDLSEARDLLAYVYEQLGFQTECATWRNSYLTAALELRQNVLPEDRSGKIINASLAYIPTNFLLDLLATRLDPAKVNGETSVFIVFTDTGEEWTWFLENSVLNAWPEKYGKIRSEYKLTRKIFDDLASKKLKIEEAITSGKVTEMGEPGQLAKILNALEDTPNFNFGIVTP